MEVTGVGLTHTSRLRIVDGRSCRGKVVATAHAIEAAGNVALYTFGTLSFPFLLGQAYSVCWFEEGRPSLRVGDFRPVFQCTLQTHRRHTP